jgi:hypothetical protein
MIPDKHDPRLFRHYAKLGADGSVLATVEVALGAEQPDTASGDYMEITAIHPYDDQKLTALIEDSPVESIKNRLQVGKAIG